MILRERIIRWMQRQNKPVSRAMIVARFNDVTHHAVDSALERARCNSHLQPVGNQYCPVGKCRASHYTLTKKAIDYLNGNKPEAYGKFTLHKNQHGYEHLLAEPVSYYTDEKTGFEISVYPAGYAIGFKSPP